MSTSYDPLVEGSGGSTSTSPGADFQRLEAYSWAEDTDFQAGLASILQSQAPTSDETQLEDLALRARCFYFSRKSNVTIDPVAYSAWRIAQPPHDLSPLLPPQPATASKTVLNGQDSSIQPSLPSQPLSAHSSSVTAAAGPPQPPPYSANFEEIVRLIQSGEPIPGIKDIPDTVLDGQGSEETQPQRRKPWENKT